VAELRKKSVRFTSSAVERKDEFFTVCFHESTLRQLLFLKKNLQWRTSGPRTTEDEAAGRAKRLAKEREARHELWPVCSPKTKVNK
jgi:hypothetical protein